MSAGQLGIFLIHGVVGWGLCGAVMGFLLARTTEQRAVAWHAVAAPIIFAVITFVYFTYFGYTGPLVTALVFVGVVITLDVLIVALLIQRDFAMFGSILGTWLPFGLIFLATLSVGSLAGG